MPIHDGHRQRMRSRFLKEGLDNFEPHQVLELLLFYCVPRRDTNEIAHSLLKRFGSVAGVLDAPLDELKRVENVGEGTAVFLTLMKEFYRYYQVGRASVDQILNSIEKCGDYLVPHFFGRRNETVFLLCLDAKCKVLQCKEVGEGSVNSASVPIRRIVEMALGANATSVVIAHNHPSGLAFPSDEDKLTTRKLGQALGAVDIQLVDHIVVADDDYISLAQSGYYDPNDCLMLV